MKSINLTYDRINNLSNCKLPEEVKNFNCSNNNINNLIGGPKIIHGSYIAKFCNLKSLEGAPNIVEVDFIINSNKITSLKYGPKIVKNTYYTTNNVLLESIEGIANQIGTFIFNKKIKDIWKISYLTHITDSIIYDNDSFEPSKFNEILNKYKNGGKQAAFELQQELIEAGWYN